jgi:hypothetical protein
MSKIAISSLSSIVVILTIVHSGNDHTGAVTLTETPLYSQYPSISVSLYFFLLFVSSETCSEFQTIEPWFSTTSVEVCCTVFQSTDADSTHSEIELPSISSIGPSIASELVSETVFHSSEVVSDAFSGAVISSATAVTSFSS